MGNGGKCSKHLRLCLSLKFLEFQKWDGVILDHRVKKKKWENLTVHLKLHQLVIAVNVATLLIHRQ